MEQTTRIMPAIFIGHGSPILAIQENPFTKNWKKMTQDFPQPKAILCVSAHWVSNGLRITTSPNLDLIYDFGGFPQEMYEIKYPAKSSEWLIGKLTTLLANYNLIPDNQRGLDHGAWVVCRELYPNADVPIVQMSLDANLSLGEHYELAKKLTSLREEGVLILASGNLVHNLREIDWPRVNEVDHGFEWAKVAQKEMLEWIEKEDWDKLLSYYKQGSDINRAIPSGEHFIPLLYILAQKRSNDKTLIFNENLVGGSLDMTSVALLPQ